MKRFGQRLFLDSDERSLLAKNLVKSQFKRLTLHFHFSSQKVGGYDGSVRLSSAEVYNPRSDTWREVSNMLISRRNFGIEVLNDRIYVVGGSKDRSTNVEYYDATTDKWAEARHMVISRSAVSCCVLSGLRNMDEYVFPRDSLAVVS
ncbi:hypothetical protein VZT92_018732 [Zoarces viviparus]|uniref:Uncharacterized protein n=1 Tax=Zoarces viviparus TaxID=48416 RepID=A0AAW1EK67_ZOAVI